MNENYTRLFNYGKGLLPNVVSIIILLAIIKIAAALGYNNFWYLTIILTAFMVIMKIYSTKKLSSIASIEFVKSWIVMIITMKVLFLLLDTLGGYGVLGFIAVILLLSLWKLFGSAEKRKRYFDAVKLIESMIWGKNLDEYKSEGKKPPKLKFVWKKKDKDEITLH